MPSTFTADDLLAEVLNRNDRSNSVANPAGLRLDEAAIVERLADSCQSVLAKMCKLTVTRSGTNPGCPTKRFELSGVINISGSILVTVVINLSKEFAFKVTEALTGLSPAHIDSDVLDVVGELANMIAGSAKESFRDNSITLGLPTVISGVGHQVGFRPDMTQTILSFASSSGPMQIEVGVAH